MNSDNWILHKNKRPINIRGKSLSITKDKPYDYETALEAWLSGIGDGLGFILGPPYVGIDIDNCITDGNLTKTARVIIDKLDSYTELSYGKNGIHIIIEADLPKAIKTKNFEAYSKGRYFTMSLYQMTRRDVEPRQKELDEVVKWFRG